MTSTYLFIASIIDGSLSSNKKDAIYQNVKKIYQQHISNHASVKILWIHIPAKQAYQNKHLSQTSTLLAPVEDQLPNDRRQAFLFSLLSSWMDNTGCSKDEIVISAPDQSLANEFLTANKQRVNALHLPGFNVKLVSRLFYSLLFNRRLEININP